MKLAGCGMGILPSFLVSDSRPPFFPGLMNAIDSPTWRTSLVVQWLKLHASHGRAMCSIPGQGTKIPYAMVKFIYIYKDSPSWSFPSRLQFLYLQLTPVATTPFIYWKDLSKTITALKTLTRSFLPKEKYCRHLQPAGHPPLSCFLCLSPELLLVQHDFSLFFPKSHVFSCLLCF